MENRAIIFVRRGAAYGIGHVGWAFADENGIFSVGAVENHGGGIHTPPAEMGFWAMHTHDPITPMRDRRYNEFKVIDLDQADAQHAKGVVAWVKQQAYAAFGRNCMDDAYDVLRAYGVQHLPVPAHHWEPNHWFNQVQGVHYQIDDNGVDQVANQQAKAHGPLLSDFASLTPDPQLETTPAAPAWRVPGTDEAAHFDMALKAAPPMPASLQNWLGRLLHLLGITR